MSIKATNFVRALRGLSPSEKLVAFVLGDHDDHRGSGSWPSMTTVALEAGFAFRQNVSDLVQGLADKKIIYTKAQSKGGRPTCWQFNYSLAGCDPSVTIAPVNRSLMGAVRRTKPQSSNCSSSASTAVETAVGNKLNCSPKGPEPQSRDCRKGLEGLNQRQRGRGGGSSSSSGGNPAEDEDGRENGHRRRPFNLSPRLVAWARTQILKRAGHVNNQHAFLRTALPAFFEALDQEIIAWATECARGFCLSRLKGGDREAVIQWSEIEAFVRGEARKWEIPLTDDLVEVGIRSSNELLSLVEKPLRSERFA